MVDHVPRPKAVLLSLQQLEASVMEDHTNQAKWYRAQCASRGTENSVFSKALAEMEWALDAEFATTSRLRDELSALTNLREVERIQSAELQATNARLQRLNLEQNTRLTQAALQWDCEK